MNLAQPLANQRFLLVICGGIAAYKCADLVQKMQDLGAIVRVTMTPAATQFITPLTFQALTGQPVLTQLWDRNSTANAMPHIELAKWPDRIIIAPATANMIAKIAGGIADDLITTTLLASDAPMVVAPAMNQQMWHARSTQKNISTLKQQGVMILGPADGRQACGDQGFGRMLEPEQILAGLLQAPIDNSKRLHVVITAGPTVEAIDPVRYISNHSSGKMGYALAQAAFDIGARVSLISGPTALKPPKGVECVRVTSATQMLTAVEKSITDADIFIANAAVSDYAAASVLEQKIKKTSDQLTLTLQKNPDILATIAARPDRPYTVGFAAETQNLIENATQKLKQKKLDMIIANPVGETLGFNQDTASAVMLTSQHMTEFAMMSKKQLATKLIKNIFEMVTQKNEPSTTETCT